MRPRVFPAEDVSEAVEDGALEGPSMRPRVFPAEDGARRRVPGPRHAAPSMRPRVFPAEDVREGELSMEERRLQ